MTANKRSVSHTGDDDNDETSTTASASAIFTSAIRLYARFKDAKWLPRNRGRLDALMYGKPPGRPEGAGTTRERDLALAERRDALMATGEFTTRRRALEKARTELGYRTEQAIWDVERHLRRIENGK